MKVVIEECKSYSDVDIALESGLKKLGGIGEFVKEGEKVLLKPNLLSARNPEEAVTTHPEVIRAVIKQVKKVTQDITIADSPGFIGDIRGWDKVIEKTGIKALAEEESVKVESLKTPKEVENKEGVVARKFIISEEIFKYDKVINIAKLKTHSLTVYTGAVKNMFGIIPGKLKSGMHTKFQDPTTFSKMLLDLYALKKAELNIIDGIYGMEGQGPSAGEKRHFGILGISDDALALDYVITKGLKLDVPLIKIAEERGMIKNLEVFGEFNDEIKKPSSGVLESVVFPLAGNLRRKFSSKPVLTEEKCTKCESCFKICPVFAIKMAPYPKFDYKTCIRCYCCHEICPEKAIYLKKSLAQKILRK